MSFTPELKGLIKCHKVAQSCKTEDHYWVALKFIQLYKKYFNINYRIEPEVTLDIKYWDM